MSSEDGAMYQPNDLELDVYISVVANHAGGEPDTIRTALVETWIDAFNGAPGEDQHDWFDWLTGRIASMPSDSERQTREEIMKHAEQTRHSVRIVSVRPNQIVVACKDCGAYGGPWSPSQAV
jgi:hypothetical protein